MSGKVFISYRSEGGAETARLVRDALKKRSYQVFMDVEDLRSGPFNTALFGEIESCTDMVVILTPNSLDRCWQENDWLRLEVAHALKHNKNVIPVMTRGFSWPSATLPEDIEKLRFQQGVEPSPVYFEASMDRLAKMLAGRPPPHSKWWVLMVGVLVVAGALAGVYVMPTWFSSKPSTTSSTTDKLQTGNAVLPPSSDAITSGSSQSPKKSAPLVDGLQQADAALVVAGMYFGQVLLRVSVTGVSEGVRASLMQHFRVAGIKQSTIQKVRATLDKAAQGGSQKEVFTSVGNMLPEISKAAERANPAFGEDAFKFGLHFGFFVMGINVFVDMPVLPPEQSDAIVSDFQKHVMKHPSFAVARDLRSRLPFPARLKAALDRMFAQNFTAFEGCQRAAREAALFCFLIWRIAEEGLDSLDKVRSLPDQECASRMSVRLEMEGFVVAFPGVPSKLTGIAVENRK